jgi:hypothetical protein
MRASFAVNDFKDWLNNPLMKKRLCELLAAVSVPRLWPDWSCSRGSSWPSIPKSHRHLLSRRYWTPTNCPAPPPHPKTDSI